MKPHFRILVVDDETIVCERLSAELTRFGFDVEAFADSAEALERIAEQRFDVVVTDIKMRGPSGIDLLKFLKDNYPSTKVIVITGFATVETAREALKGGAADFIAKPFKMSQLRELIASFATGAREGSGPGADKGTDNRSA